MKARYVPAVGSLLIQLFATAPMSGVNGADAEKDPPNLANSTVPYTLPATAKYDYAEVLHKSLLFYHSQRSGKLGPNRRLAWRGDSCFICTGPNGEDLSGGYYEAANTMKWGLPLAFTVTQLAWNVYAWGDAMASVNELEEAKEGVKWGVDYLVNCISSPENFVGQFGVSAVGSTDIDFGYFGPPEEYEMWVPNKIMHPAGLSYINSTNPSSEILGETAATMAASSVIFKDSDPDYSAKLLDHAKDLYNRATTHLGSYQNSTDPNMATVKQWYPSSIYYDELAWGAAWLYVATQDESYRTVADSWRAKASDHNSEYSWDEKLPGVNALLYSVTKNDTYKAGVESFMANFFPGGSVKQTAKGLIFADSWGSLSYGANIGFIMMVYAKTAGYDQTNSTKAISMAAQQINYSLGDCGRSWVVGFGEGSPIRPYHKSSYNSFIDYPLRGQDNSIQGDDFLNSNTTNRFILYGALEGGPAWDDTFKDNRANYEYTEVTQDYNAAFTGLNAALIDYYGKSNFKAFTDCGLDLGWSHPNASNFPNWGDNDCYHTCNTNCTTSNTGSNSNSSGSNSSSGNKANAAATGRQVVGWGVGAALAGAIAAILA
ncbi:hypothetical protein FRC05_006650 [Tulasnella sp. 425]|nr:hypothetical protein FRC05_006650 [Tulasnella sp. 425]